MEPVRFPPSIAAAVRAEWVKPAESRRDAGREHAFRRFLKGGDPGAEEGGGPGGESGLSPEAAAEGKTAAPAERAAEEPARGRRIDIRI